MAVIVAEPQPLEEDPRGASYREDDWLVAIGVPRPEGWIDELFERTGGIWPDMGRVQPEPLGYDAPITHVRRHDDNEAAGFDDLRGGIQELLDIIRPQVLDHVSGEDPINRFADMLRNVANVPQSDVIPSMLGVCDQGAVTVYSLDLKATSRRRVKKVTLTEAKLENDAARTKHLPRRTALPSEPGGAEVRRRRGSSLRVAFFQQRPGGTHRDKR